MSKHPLVASPERARFLLSEVERIKALDQERIKRSEIKASDLHLIDAETARNAKVTWKFGRKRSEGSA